MYIKYKRISLDCSEDFLTRKEQAAGAALKSLLDQMQDGFGVSKLRLKNN